MDNELLVMRKETLPAGEDFPLYFDKDDLFYVRVGVQDDVGYYNLVQNVDD